MIEPIDYRKYVIPDFPHSIRYHKDKDGYEEALVNWHKLNDSTEAEFKADLEDYLMNYLAIELDQDSVCIEKIRTLVEIAMSYVEEYEEVEELAVRMLPLIMSVDNDV